jgi:hypothetical protein
MNATLLADGNNRQALQETAAMLDALIVPDTQVLPLPSLRRAHAWRQPVRSRTEAEILALYLAGWSEADPYKIAEATAADYAFEDAFVGRFSRHSLPRYFEVLRTRFAVCGPTARKELAFTLRGPMESFGAARTSPCWQEYWREAPCLGLTGVARIMVTPKGIAADVVCYDLNMACKTLRGM